MSLPVRSSTPREPSLKHSLSTTSTCDAPSTAHVTAIPSDQTQHPLRTTQIKRNSPSMSPYMNSSSPLSSAESLPTPPGAWVDDNAPALVPAPAAKPAPVTKPAPVCKFDSLKNGVRAPSPTGSVKSATSTGSKKRSHAEAEGSQTIMTSGKRVKKTTPKATQKATPRAAPSAPLTGTRSSGRARKATERFADFVSPPKAKAAPTRKPAGSKVFEPVFITTNSNSRLKKTDVFHMLLEPSAWTCLTSDEKLEILALLPKNAINVKLVDELRAGTAAENARPKEFNINFNLFRTDVAKFKEDLENGHLGKTWQASAEHAMLDRAAGKFDDWKEQQAERWWGQN